VLVPDNTLSWPEVAARLATARNYWLCTTTPSGAPHAAPVWGAVIGQVLYLYSERRTGEDDRPYPPDADPDFDVVYAISPQSAMMWRLADYAGSQRRWTS
jgi:hypothetical protein